MQLPVHAWWCMYMYIRLGRLTGPGRTSWQNQLYDRRVDSIGGRWSSKGGRIVNVCAYLLPGRTEWGHSSFRRGIIALHLLGCLLRIQSLRWRTTCYAKQVQQRVENDELKIRRSVMIGKHTVFSMYRTTLWCVTRVYMQCVRTYTHIPHVLSLLQWPQVQGVADWWLRCWQDMPTSTICSKSFMQSFKEI